MNHPKHTQDILEREEVQIPKRYGWVKWDVNISGEKINQLVHIRGRWLWSWKFPFLHRKIDTLYAMTKSGLFILTYEP